MDHFDDITVLGRQISKVRKERGFTAEDLAVRCFISPAYLRQIEFGVKLPSLPLFVYICNALKVSPDYLLQDVLRPNEISRVRELDRLWNEASVVKQEIACTMLKALLADNRNPYLY